MDIMEMNNDFLFKNKADCCGCGVCMNICPGQAITMKEDEYGFIFPNINKTLCIKCGLCVKTCAFQSEGQTHIPLKVYIVASKENDILVNSASGGLFTELAKNFILQGGIVCGCSMEIINNKLYPMHVIVSKSEDLHKLQGSKYVQSDTHMIYRIIRDKLNSGYKVLFSGTPCQVDALKRFLNYNVRGLFTVDLICHGVPSIKMFQGYVDILEVKYGKIDKYIFRDKTDGWGLRSKIEYIDSEKKRKIHKIHTKLSSYYSLFLDSHIYRENCYFCKYARKNRVSDITIGDYWGAKKIHPEYFIGRDTVFDEKMGVSCAIINSKYGEEKLFELKEKGNINIAISSFENVSSKNEQLRHPAKNSEYRTEILELFRNGGYKSVDKWYLQSLGYKKYFHILWTLIPGKIKNVIRRIYHFKDDK